MGRRPGIGAIALLAIALAVLARAWVGGGSGPEEGERGGPALAGHAVSARVVRVIDGDTIEVSIEGQDEDVRYIGVDTPETHHPTKPVQCYGRAASAFNARLVARERVRLVRDVEERDRFGRLLAYVYRARDGLFVNAELARAGYARPLPIAPDVRYAGRFAGLAQAARQAGRGLWSAC